MTLLGRWAIVSMAVVCLTSLCVIGGVSDAVAAQSTNETANGSIQHERPESVGESGNLERLQGWLGDHLGQRLESSTIALSQGEYERARSVIGDSYDDRLAQYVDVAGETGEGGDAAETYREVSEGQQDLATQTQRFDEADERYQAARENGESAAARDAAREMNRLADRISTTGGDVTSGYATLETQTSLDTSQEQAAVTNLTRTVNERRVEVRDETFVETSVTVVDATRTISFTDPLAVTARITTANGTALANRTLAVTVNGRAQSVTTDDGGQFSFSYRPRMLRVNTSTVQLAYVPRNESVYLGSNATVPVDVEQVSPTLTVREVTAETSFGQPVGARVVVTVDGDRVSGVPVDAVLDGYRVGRAVTNEAGGARVESELPASVPTGDHEIRASVPLENRAIGPATMRADVTVASTATNLTLAGTQDDGNVTVSGQLLTADGRPVADQSVQIARNGSAVTTVSTGPAGTYAVTLPLDRDGDVAGATVEFGGRFDGTGTNLDASTAVTTLEIQDHSVGSSGSSALEETLPVSTSWLVVTVGVVIVLVVGGAVAWRRQTSTDDRVTESTAAGVEPAPASTAEGAEADPTPAIDRAEAFLDRGAAGAAVRAAYASAREQYLPDDPSGTHWELLDRTRTLARDERTAMEQVVNAYELVAFSPTDVEVADATAAVAAARTVLGLEARDKPDDD